MTMQAAFAFALALIILSVSASAKTGSTFFSPEMVANATRNIERYDWARTARDNAVKNAEPVIKLSDDFLWNLVASQDIPRGIHVNMSLGCPKCGKAIEKFGNYPWKCDVVNRPWKIQCPSCGEIFPKNDFAKYYESGKDEHGVFHLDRADRSLLFNSDHPDPKDPLHNYGVDDCLGWKDDKGDTYRFIGYYGHYGIWTAIRVYLNNLRDAYLYTGDPVYARKAGILLYRIAEFYPDMDWSKWEKLGFTNSDGHTGHGKIYGCIWEPDLSNSFILTYDAIYSALDDPQMLDYLSNKAGKKVTASAIKKLFENNVIYEAHDSILRRQIEGNEGMYQQAMTIAAVVLDEPGVSDKWLDWIFAPGDLRHGNPSGGNLRNLFDSRIDDDGMGDEASPNYNGIWRGCFRNISVILERYPQYKGTRFTDIPKYKKMFETPAHFVCLGRFMPNIGDSNSTGAPGVGGIGVGDMLYAYHAFKDPLFARMAWFLNGNKADGMRGDIFDPEPEQIKSEIEGVVKKYGPYVPKTEEKPSYGLSILRSGSGDNARALSIYCGRNIGHGHKDTLNIDLFAFGLSLMPDLGYPEYASMWPSRYEWTENTTSHNTVLVDRKKQKQNLRGKSRFVQEGRGVSAAEIYSDAAYPQTSLYQRTAAMVDVNDKDFYVVDIFRVCGGNEQHYILHGAEGEVETEGLNLIAQSKGTLAGENIEYGADLGGRETAWSEASGFNYLYDVRRDAKPSNQPSVTWKVKDTWHLLKEPKDIRLRVNLLTPPGEVILASGDPPQNKPGNPRRLTYLLSDNKGNSATFASVIEPYIGTRSIKSIERTDEGDTVIIKVILTSGRVDYIVSSTKSKEHEIAGAKFTGRFAVISKDGDKAEVKLVAGS